VFQIGIFPYMSLAFCVFFFEPRTIQRIFFKKKPFLEKEKAAPPPYKNAFLVFFGIYFLFQIGLPLRHHFMADNVLWTEEGHRLSWRMMLRSKTGSTQFRVINKQTGQEIEITLGDHLSKKQRRRVQAYPDFMWQFAQRLKKIYAEKGIDISVFVDSRISVNGRPYQDYIDPNVDLANEEWDHLRHHEWILPSKLTGTD
ncbi:MAG: HTTM domain-containing protein, partial [Flavobacteriaceae bacterium]